MEVDMTALEKKWAQEKAEKQPSLDDAYRSDGSLDVNSITEDVKSHIPRPTGWRLVVLPYRGAQKTKGGILLADQTIERQQVTLADPKSSVAAVRMAAVWRLDDAFFIASTFENIRGLLDGIESCSMFEV